MFINLTEVKVHRKTKLLDHKKNVYFKNQNQVHAKHVDMTTETMYILLVLVVVVFCKEIKFNNSLK